MDEDNKTKHIKRPNAHQRHAYLENLLKNTVMTGLPQIATEHNLKRKVFKILVFFACLFGFFYQLTEFLMLYFTYPTSLEVLVKITTEDYLPKPVITMCDLNGIRRTVFCKDFPNLCEKPKNVSLFCIKNSQFCDKENFTDDDLMVSLVVN
ncbi:uncharacterized protein LOC111634194 [Centruroides sculpturatus]|uniref:uncharacterized protein LOC111634194 n=1 Tax=Centruroides sculpturatus TaxID=218467 RepID=UPI000C6E3E0D|nr:uncharacterized protein LOC111634194 [Centruroides sculpturatus]